MKKGAVCLFLLVCVSMLLCAESNINLNEEMFVKENLRLRSSESATSSIITTMRTATKVEIIEIGKSDVIDGYKSNWVKVKILEGKDVDGNNLKKDAVGWCYAGYLSDTVGRYDYIDLSDRNLKIKKIGFMTLQEEKAWRKLAGYYFVRQPRSTIPEVEEDDTDWGKDYVYFGRGCHSILYKNGKWIHGGDGEAEEFELASVSEDGNTFVMKNGYSTQTWEISGEYLYINSFPYYKITGPDCYKRFLKGFVKEYNDSVKKYAETRSGYSKKLGKIPDEILKALSNGDIKSYAKYADSEEPVDLVIADYRQRSTFLLDELIDENDEVKSAFDFMKSDLSGHKSKIGKLKPQINEFINSTVNDFETNHKDADVLVEYTFDSYRYIQMFFKIKQDSVCLVGLNEYSVYRP